MRDGKIADDHRVESLVKEDLRELARSRLGRLLMDGAEDTVLAEIGWDQGDEETAIETLRLLLHRTLTDQDAPDKS
jgi:hypothetical protein